jgi:hypothetical protein
MRKGKGPPLLENPSPSEVEHWLKMLGSDFGLQVVRITLAMVLHDVKERSLDFLPLIKK